jgi:hypothetical protein
MRMDGLNGERAGHDNDDWLRKRFEFHDAIDFTPYCCRRNARRKTMSAFTYFDFVREFCTAMTPQGRVVPLELYPTQRRFAERLFHVDPQTWRRPIRRALYAAPKKTGKTGFIATIVAHHFFFGEEVNREIPLFAWDLDQTEYLYQALQGLIGLHVIRRLARDEFGSHGGNPSMVVSDETWTLSDSSMLAALSFSPLRLDPLMLFTSYAGFESDMKPGRPLYDLWLKLQPGAELDDTFLGVWMTGADARREVPWWSESWVREQARLLASEPWEFRRLVENEWAAGAAGMFTADDVAAMISSEPRPTADRHGDRRITFVDLGWSHDDTAAVTVSRDSDGCIVVDDVLHRPSSKEKPLDFDELERELLALSYRFRTEFIVDQWQARMLITRLRRRGLTVREVTIGAPYHDRIARSLLTLQQAGRIRIPAHGALVQQLRAVVLQRSSSFRDDSTNRLRIDSGAGVGVAAKDDIVVALAGAAFEAGERLSRGACLAVIKVPPPGPAPSNFMLQLRAEKSARLAAQLALLPPRSTDV